MGPHPAFAGGAARAVVLESLAMKATRAFRIIGRVNQVLLLALFLLVAAVAGGELVSSALRQEARDRAARVEAAPAHSEPEGPVLEFRDPVSMDGTAYSVLALVEEDGTRSKFGSEPYVAWTRNLLFHDASSGTTRWLRPDSRACLDWDRIRELSESVRWIRYEIAEADTDGDGRITCADRSAIAISDPGGDGLATVLREVDRVRGYAPLQGTVLTVFYVRGREERVADIDLVARKVIRDQLLPKP